VDCALKLQIGDQVRVSIDDTHMLLSSFLLYLLPLLAMLTGVGLANALLPAAITEVWLPEIAFLFLLLAFNVLHRLQPLFLLHFCFKPQIVGKF
jgi:sigma-E factor negative regulatory protein RseC